MKAKQYVYRAEEVGLAQWPSGELRLQGFEVTMNPVEADIFVCPGPLMLFQDPAMLDRFPYMSGRETHHVFFDVSDYEPVYSKPCLFIRCNTRDWYLHSDPNTISWAWPVENYAECIDVPEGGFKFDVSFQGWLSSDARKAAVESCRQSDLKFDIAGYPDFCGYIYDQPEGIRRRAEFRRSMRESRVCLCPESIPGVFPYRFFEAMSAGRVPLLVGSSFMLPFADEIPYSEFSLFVPSSRAIDAADAVRRLIGGCSDAQIVEMGLKARQYWLRFLNRDDWPRTMSYAVCKKLIEIESRPETAVLECA